MIPELDCIAVSIKALIMSRYNYLYSPVLNFVKTCLRQSNITKDAIVSTDGKFFGKDLIPSGHTLLYGLVREPDEQFVKNRQTQATSDVFMSDICELLKVASNIPDFKTCFTIWKIGDLPSTPHDILTPMTVRVNECTDMIEDLIEQWKASLLESPAWPG